MEGEVDTKHKAIIRGSRHISYMECNGLTKELLKQKEMAGSLNMGGDEYDENSSSVIGVIIEAFAKETPNEAVFSELYLFSAITFFQMSGGETVPAFVNRFKNSVPKYVNNTAELKDFADLELAILMRCNEQMSSNTMNAVKF